MGSLCRPVPSRLDLPRHVNVGTGVPNPNWLETGRTRFGEFDMGLDSVPKLTNRADPELNFHAWVYRQEPDSILSRPH
jgi:hypothetical protein